MKILVVSNMYPDDKHPFYGTFVKTFCDQLRNIDQDYDLSVMLKKDSKIKKIFSYIEFYFKTIFKILFFKYDCIYIHYASHSSLPVLIASKIKKITIYTNVHGSDVIPENKKQQKMQKYTRDILKISKKIIVPSDYFKEIVFKKYNICNKNSILVYPSGGIDESVFFPVSDIEKDEIKIEYGLDLNIPTFGMAGRISADKGWDVFVKAIATAVKNGLQANYIIVGSGDEESYLYDLIKKYNLENVIKIIPLLAQNELRKYYNILDFFVFPTKREGESLGLVAIEAMACGTPVISSDFAAPKYYVVSGYNGFKFAVGDYHDLATTMETAITISNKEILKMNAIQTASTYYSKNVSEDLKNIFAEV